MFVVFLVNNNNNSSVPCTMMNFNDGFWGAKSEVGVTDQRLRREEKPQQLSGIVNHDAMDDYETEKL